MEVKNVTILGQKYKISKDNKMPEAILEELHGYCDREKSIIWVNPKQSLEHKYRTLFHEMGHGVMYRNGVSFSGMIPIELEEIIVETMASMQYEFTRDFLKGLLKHDDKLLRDKISTFVRGRDKA